MEESQLLIKLNTLENSLRLLDINIQLWNDGNEKDEFRRQKETALIIFEETKELLENIEDKTFSRNAKKIVLDQFWIYIEKIGTRRNPIQLQRTEGINFQNSLFSNLLTHINLISRGEQLGIHIPYLAFSLENNNSIEIESFIQFIHQERDIINNIENVNFITLKEYYSAFYGRLIETFINPY
jgi:hypothetical protein